jgi:hypothetical protein
MPRHQNYRPWTTTEERQLRQLWNAGHYIKVIAAMMSRSEQSVKAKSDKLGLPHRHKSLGGGLTVRVYIPYGLFFKITCPNKSAFIRQCVEEHLERQEMSQ